jgi:hypothetical protein
MNKQIVDIKALYRKMRKVVEEEKAKVALILCLIWLVFLSCVQDLKKIVL